MYYPSRHGVHSARPRQIPVSIEVWLAIQVIESVSENPGDIWTADSAITFALLL
jgi:hypothetical protein